VRLGGLDCPTSAPVMNFGEGPACVLARLAVRVENAVEPGRPHMLMSWPLEIDAALWIELRT
jgi:hypothetical protein